MVYEKCCVGGCNTTRETHRLFRFPRNDNLRNLWMAFIVPTNPQLIVLSKEQLLNKRVCEKHFDVFQFGNEGRRLRYSYPSLLTDNEIAHGVPLTATGWDVTTEHNYCKEQNEDDFTEAVLVVRKPGSDVTIEHNYYKEQNDYVGNSHEQPSCSNFSTVATVVENKGIDSNANVVKQMMPKGSTCTKKQTGLVCDQGSTFRTAIRRLREDTIRRRNIQGVHDDGSKQKSNADVVRQMLTEDTKCTHWQKGYVV
ncbi:unnamed protein product [Parnassius apollo]|uniref:(apollo) hypothetical protein n=1 Tax=Parnassius apollo TaxID=110799 RepID=A0A8S3WW37_PARAO|nr:unnamed protein product [Parnassius apollo]